MVLFPIKTGIRKIADKNLTPQMGLIANTPWLAEDITIKLSSPDVLGTIVVDFGTTVNAVVAEYTLDGGSNFVAFNNGDTVLGGQSRFIDVTDGNVVNFRSQQLMNLIRIVVSSVP